MTDRERVTGEAVFDPLGQDDALLSAIAALDAALVAAAARHGVEIVSVVVGWVVNNPDATHTCGSLIAGSDDPEVLGLLMETVMDESGTTPIDQAMGRVLN